MGRIIGSAVAGYVVVFVGVFALMTAAWFALGVNGAFQPGVWDVTPSWLAVMLVVSLVAAILGGYVAMAIARDPRGPKVLAGIVVVMGILFAIPVLTGEAGAPLPRPDELPMLDAMNNGRQPAWVALLNPVLGAIGVLFGARLRSSGNA